MIIYYNFSDIGSGDTIVDVSVFEHADTRSVEAIAKITKTLFIVYASKSDQILKPANLLMVYFCPMRPRVATWTHAM